MYPDLILHVLDIYADEVAVSNDSVSLVLYVWYSPLLAISWGTAPWLLPYFSEQIY